MLVHHAHGLAHLSERGLGDLVGAAVALVQDVLDVVHILDQFLAAGADGGKVLVHAFGDVLLELAGAAHADLFGDLDLGAAGADRGGGEQAGHAGTGFGVERDHALAVGLALLDALGRLLSGHGDVDGVAVGLAHLAPVKAGQQRRVGQQRVDLGEHLAVAVVELACDGAGELDVRQLVAPDRHHVALAEQDVARLVHGVGEQKAGELMAAGLHLGLDGGVFRGKEGCIMRLHRNTRLVFAFGNMTVAVSYLHAFPFEKVE